MKNSILFMIHCEQNTGYAIEKLEAVFKSAALMAGYSEDQIYWSFSKVFNGSNHTFELNYHSENVGVRLSGIIKSHNISTILAFDLPFRNPVIAIARKHGVKKIISYWGASMSSINMGVKLYLKKLEHRLFQQQSADLYIFESKAMQSTATHGRGIPEDRTCVIPLGVNIDEYYPSLEKSYIHDRLNIPINRKIIFYSGHMEERKGVRTIVRAARKLAERNQLSNIHFVLCGNTGDQAETYLKEIRNNPAVEHVTFAGYRNDIAELMRSSNIGVIASTGWDSFTRSSIELLASGIPLIASDLGGLAETTAHNESGYLFEPGNENLLADYITELATNSEKLSQFSAAARTRAENLFTEDKQIHLISKTLSKD